MRSEAKIGLAVVMLMAAVGAASAATSIKNSKHDLSSGSAADIKGNTNQICVYCHTPHNAAQPIPLWNRTNAAAASEFLLYSSVTMDNPKFQTGFTSDSISLFCMSCHDATTNLGATAVHNEPADQPGGITITDVANKTSGGVLTGSATDADLGKDLRDDHPVNFLVINGNDPNIGTVTGSKIRTSHIDNALPLFKSARGADATTLECASCHAVHDNTNAPFLRTTMEGSLLCLGCHNK